MFGYFICVYMVGHGQLEKEANALKENLDSLTTKLAQLSANQQAATDSLEQMAKSADESDR